MAQPKPSPVSKYNSGKTAPLSNQGENGVPSTSSKVVGSKVSRDKITQMPAVPSGAPVTPMSADMSQPSPAMQIMRAVAKASNARVTASQNAHSPSDQQNASLGNADDTSHPSTQPANFKANNGKAKKAGNGKSRYNSTAPDQSDVAIQKDKKSPYDSDFS